MKTTCIRWFEEEVSRNLNIGLWGCNRALYIERKLPCKRSEPSFLHECQTTSFALIQVQNFQRTTISSLSRTSVCTTVESILPYRPSQGRTVSHSVSHTEQKPLAYHKFVSHSGLATIKLNPALKSPRKWNPSRAKPSKRPSHTRLRQLKTIHHEARSL